MYKYTEEELKNASSVLITHPYFGTLYMSHLDIKDGYVIGEVYDDWNREPVCMNFPVSCIKKAYDHDGKEIKYKEA